MKILITSPSLNTDENISGISSVVSFIMHSNPQQEYIHFRLGRRDSERRDSAWFFSMVRTYFSWLGILLSGKDIMVHFNMALCKFSVIRDFPLILIARLSRKRMVIHLHGGDYMTHKDPPLWMRILMKISLSGNNPVIVLSSAEAEIIERRIAKARIRTLPNCISLHEAYEFNRDYSGDKMIRLLFMGRIEADKGLEFIYRALVSLKNRGLIFNFVMAGRGALEYEYSRKFSELLGRNFEFTGVATGITKTEILKRCNVFLLPSFYEGLPMALLESMSFGLVPVVTNVGSINQVVTDQKNGIFVADHSSVEIENAILELSADIILRHSLSKNARNVIFNNFDPEVYIRKLNEIYAYD
jgi:glycosyltransferase involved in cell wall biosynthesis